jgi:hypothetical protein
MTVHVGEMHTDVRPAPEPEAGPGTGPTGATADEAWGQSRGRVEWLCLRTAAEGFDD